MVPGAETASSGRRGAVSTRHLFYSVPKRNGMDWRKAVLPMEILLVGGIVAFWFLLQIWILPALGVPT